MLVESVKVRCHPNVNGEFKKYIDHLWKSNVDQKIDN